MWISTHHSIEPISTARVSSCDGPNAAWVSELHSSLWYVAYLLLLFQNIQVDVPLFAMFQMETDTPVAASDSCLMVAIGCALLFTIWHFRVLWFLLVRIFGCPKNSLLSQCPPIFHLHRTNATANLGLFNLSAFALLNSPLRCQATVVPFIEVWWLWKCTISFSTVSLAHLKHNGTTSKITY